MARQPKKPGIQKNTTEGEPTVFEVPPSDVPVTIAIWRERSGKLRFRATTLLNFLDSPPESGFNTKRGDE